MGHKKSASSGFQRRPGEVGSRQRIEEQRAIREQQASPGGREIDATGQPPTPEKAPPQEQPI